MYLTEPISNDSLDSLVGLMVQYSQGVDRSASTYVTFYMLSLCCLFVGCVVLLKYATVDNPGSTKLMGTLSACALFFGYCIYAFTMGWLHEYYKHWDNSERRSFFHIWNFATIMLSIAAAGSFCVAEVFRKYKNIIQFSKIVESSVVVFVTILTIISIARSFTHKNLDTVHEKALFATIFFCSSLAYILALSIIALLQNSPETQSCRVFIVSVSFFAIGLLIQLALSPVCSHVNAYESMGCPLPDNFNHNCLFNIFQIIFICLIGRSITTLLSEPAYEEIDEDEEKISIISQKKTEIAEESQKGNSERNSFRASARSQKEEP